MQHWFTYPTNIDPVAIHLGPLKIHWYGIAYLVGFICVYLWMARPAGRRRLGLTKEQIQDFLFYALIGVLVGGRAFFVINDIISKHDLSLYLSNPINFIAVWNGGMAFHGGLVGVIVAIALFLRKHPGLRFRVLSDEVVMMLPIGITLVRIVNFINDELWGHVCDPDRPWCMVPKDVVTWGTSYRHPAQFYEAVLDVLTLPVLLILYRLKPKDGVVGLDLVHDLRHHPQRRGVVAPCRFHVDGNYGRPAVRASDDRHRRDRRRLLCDATRPAYGGRAGG